MPRSYRRRNILYDRPLSFESFLIITFFFIFFFTGVGLLAYGDKERGLVKDEYYLAGGLMTGISFALVIFTMFTGQLTFSDIINYLYILYLFEWIFGK